MLRLLYGRFDDGQCSRWCFERIPLYQNILSGLMFMSTLRTSLAEHILKKIVHVKKQVNEHYIKKKKSSSMLISIGQLDITVNALVINI